MKKHLKKTALLLFTALCVCTILLTPLRAEAEIFDDDVCIKNFDMTVDVAYDHSYRVHVVETVVFSDDYHHGIYRTIPVRGTFYREIDGEARESRYTAKFTDFTLNSGQPYGVQTENGEKVIKIGNPDAYVSGEQVYDYAFTYNTGKDDVTELDDVYFNIFYGGLEDDIEHVRVRINMPDSDFNPGDVHFYAVDANTPGPYTVNTTDNVITCVSTAPVPAYSTLTVKINLPEGYFKEARAAYTDAGGFTAIAAALALTGSGFAFFFKRKKVTAPVAFSAPAGTDSAQAGYIDNPDGDMSRYVTSLIVYTADKKYLSIRETEPDRFELVYEHYPSDAPAFLQHFFNALFKDKTPGAAVPVTALASDEEFYAAVQACEKGIKDYYKQPPHVLLDKTGTHLKLFLLALTAVVSVLFACVVSLKFLGYIEPILFVFFIVFPCVGYICLVFVPGFVGWLVGIIFIAIIVLFGTVVSLPLGLVFPVLYAALIFAGRHARRYTPYGRKLLGEVTGFKHLIQTAELDRIRALAGENPTYFYAVLPYAYAFSLTDIWCAHFRSLCLPQPDFYTGVRFDPVVFERTLTNTYTQSGAVYSKNHPSSGGSSGSGGGFSGSGSGGIGGGSW